jgi:hypothetical protein
LRSKAEAFPLAAGRKIHLALFLARPARVTGAKIFTPREVFRALL